MSLLIIKAENLLYLTNYFLIIINLNNRNFKCFVILYNSMATAEGLKMIGLLVFGLVVVGRFLVQNCNGGFLSKLYNLWISS